MTRRSSDSAPATANSSALRRPAIRSTRRSATAAALPAWSIGSRSSRRSSHPCSTISRPMILWSSIPARLAQRTSASPTLTTIMQSRVQSAGQAAGSYRPLATDALYLTPAEFGAYLTDWPVHRSDIFAQPESANSNRLRLRQRTRFHPGTGARRKRLRCRSAAFLRHCQGGQEASARHLLARFARADRLDPG